MASRVHGSPGMWVARSILVGMIACLIFCALGPSGGVAQAAAPAPGWAAFGFFGPTHLQPGGTGLLHLYVYNGGAEPSSGPVTVTDRLPKGLRATGSEGCTGTEEVVCTVEGVGPAEAPATLEIPVSVAADASGEAEDHVEVSGGGALRTASAIIPASFSSTPAELGFSNVDGWFTNADGTSDVQAGSHPYALTVAFALNNTREGEEETPAGGEARGLDFKLPPGLVGNPTAVPECSRELFDDGEIAIEEHQGCPASSQIGLVRVLAKGLGKGGVFPVFNIVPPPGVAALFGFEITGGATVFLDARVRSGGDDGITEHVQNAPQRQALFSSVTIWGTPAEESHDRQRVGSGCVPDNIGGCGAGVAAKPFLTLPTSCRGPQEFVAEEFSTWQEEDIKPVSRSFFSHTTEGVPTGFEGCENLAHFAPSLLAAPETGNEDTPTGLTADLRLPQGLNGGDLATAGLKEATVVLPEGVAINPGQAAGLQACQPSRRRLRVGPRKAKAKRSMVRQNVRWHQKSVRMKSRLRCCRTSWRATCTSCSPIRRTWNCWLLLRAMV